MLSKYSKVVVAGQLALSLAVGFSAIQVFAEESSNPVLAQIRAEFSNARTPTKAELQLGKKLKCIVIEALETASPKPTYENAHYEEFNGLIAWINGPSRKDYFAYTQANSLARTYESYTDDWVNGPVYATPITTNNYQEIRVTSGGDLMFEDSFDHGWHEGTPWSFEGEENYVHQSLARNGNKARYYVVCELAP